MKEEATGVVGSSISWILTVSQANEIFEIIQIIFSILVSLITIAYIIWKWYKKAKKDGKITADEVEELVDEVGKELDKNDKIKR